MSEFLVQAPLLHDASLAVIAVGSSVSDVHGTVRRHADAAAGTPAAQGLSDLTEHWGVVLPAFAAASGGLAAALRAAGADYSHTDDRVAGAARSATPGPA